MRRFTLIFVLMLSLGMCFLSGCATRSTVTDPELAAQYEMQNRQIAQEEMRRWQQWRARNQARYPHGHWDIVANDYPYSEPSLVPTMSHMRHMEQIELSREHEDFSRARGY